MYCSTLFLNVLAIVPGLVTAAKIPKYNMTETGYPPPYCKDHLVLKDDVENPPKLTVAYPPGLGQSKKPSPFPTKWGILLFQAYEPLDVFGPIEILSSLARFTHLDFSLIASTLEGVTTAPTLASMNKFNSSVYYTVKPDYTLETAPKDLEVLLIPGGLGSRSPNINSTLDFVKHRYPKLKYVVTVCTGALVASRAGILDGKRATTNKLSWNSVVVTNPKVHWIPHARWTVDGNIWTSSGVAAGMDAVSAFIACFLGQDLVTNVTK